MIDHGQQLESEIEAISQSKPQSDGVADKNLMKRISKLENMIKNKEQGVDSGLMNDVQNF